jgi:3-oxoacyl-(acyl-carrier-protein) synthase
MKIFIRAASCISPQETFNHQLFFSEPKEYTKNILRVAEPDYKNILDVKQLRRMSKIIRMGVATALTCLKKAGEKNVDAIVTGTAYGCMEDSENFLKNIVIQNEEMLSPTSFIQSTHNTVGAQIALILKCHNYNNTFVHKGFSFEHALIDATLLFHENQAQTVLAGSDDEITDFTFGILKRFGFYKSLSVSNLNLFESSTKGSIAGEGAAFFLLTNKSSDENYATLDAVDTFYNPANQFEIKNHINQFLSAQKINADDIDLIITGKNGDAKNDLIYDELQADIFKTISAINYKHLCGEYPTSSSFALWLAANIIQKKRLPECFKKQEFNSKDFKRILICNNYQNKYHSLILLSDCSM